MENEVEKLEEMRSNIHNEFLNLSTKIDKLDLFLTEHKSNFKLHKDYIKIMENQLYAMIDYKEYLYERIKYLSELINERK